MWDALTSTRSYRGAMPRGKAAAIMHESCGYWRPDVYAAFVATLL